MVRNCDPPEPDRDAFRGLVEGDFDLPEEDYEKSIEVVAIEADTVAGICSECGSTDDVAQGLIDVWLCGACAGARDSGGEA